MGNGGKETGVIEDTSLYKAEKKWVSDGERGG